MRNEDDLFTLFEVRVILTAYAIWKGMGGVSAVEEVDKFLVETIEP